MVVTEDLLLVCSKRNASSLSAAFTKLRMFYEFNLVRGILPACENIGVLFN
jgi:hypothetical protein